MFKNFLNQTEGNVSVLFAGSFAAILLTTAAVADINVSLTTKNKMQNALDNAVLTAALHAEGDDFSAYGEELYLSNFANENLGETTVEFRKVDGNIIGVANTFRPSLFPDILPESVQNISVKAAALVPEPELSQASDPNPTPISKPCIMALSQTASPGVTLNSGATIEGAGCEMHVHSENQNNAMSVNSGINITLDRTCVAGSNIVDNSQGAIGNLERNCAVSPDPYAGSIVEPADLSCDYNHGNFGESNITMQPGVYCGWFNFNNSNANVHFEPGLYVLRNGGWNVNGGKWTGDGVTFYYQDNSKIQFNSGVEANMSAPSTGDYAGFFMTERPGLSSGSFILNDNRGFNFEGILYLPSRNITFNGQSTLQARKLELIGDRITFNNARLSILSDYIIPPTSGPNSESVSSVDSLGLPGDDNTTQQAVPGVYLTR